MLLNDYLSQFAITPMLNEKDIEHWLLPKEDVVESYVVQSPETDEVTDFLQFFFIQTISDKNVKVASSLYNFLIVQVQLVYNAVIT